MNIYDYADALNLELVIRRYPNQESRFTASFADCDTKTSADSGVLKGTYGNGTSPGAAIRKYAAAISGRILVVNGNAATERRYRVPQLTGPEE